MTKFEFLKFKQIELFPNERTFGFLFALTFGFVILWSGNAFCIVSTFLDLWGFFFYDLIYDFFSAYDTGPCAYYQGAYLHICIRLTF